MKEPKKDLEQRTKKEVWPTKELKEEFEINKLYDPAFRTYRRMQEFEAKYKILFLSHMK